MSSVTNIISFKGQWRPFYVQSNKSMLKNLQSRTIVLPTPASCTFAKKECDVSHSICQIYIPSEFDKRCLCAAFPAHVVDLAANSIGNPELCRSFCFKGSPAPQIFKYALQLGFAFPRYCCEWSPSLLYTLWLETFFQLLAVKGIMPSLISFAIWCLVSFCSQ